MATALPLKQGRGCTGTLSAPVGKGISSDGERTVGRDGAAEGTSSPGSTSLAGSGDEDGERPLSFFEREVVLGVGRGVSCISASYTRGGTLRKEGGRTCPFREKRVEEGEEGGPPCIAALVTLLRLWEKDAERGRSSVGRRARKGVAWACLCIAGRVVVGAIGGEGGGSAVCLLWAPFRGGRGVSPLGGTCGLS